jgi:hypothetical protein
MTRFKYLFAVPLLFAISACAADHDANATIQFKLDFQGSNPSHYEITVTSDGHGSYVSNGVLREGESSDPEPLEFVISNSTRQQLFDLAKRAKYFSGKVESGRKNIANTGAKTLIYKDAAHNTSATYNFSPQLPIQEITAIFQGLSGVLEYGRRLTWFHKYQKLAIDGDLKQMEERQRDGTLGDVAAIAAVLKAIADDPSVMNMDRSRALRLLATATK